MLNIRMPCLNFIMIHIRKKIGTQIKLFKLFQKSGVVEMNNTHNLWIILFANNFDPDRVRQNLGPDLDPHYLKLRVGSHVVSARIHCTEKMADFFPHRCFKQK